MLIDKKLIYMAVPLKIWHKFLAINIFFIYWNRKNFLKIFIKILRFVFFVIYQFLKTWINFIFQPPDDVCQIIHSQFVIFKKKKNLRLCGSKKITSILIMIHCLWTEPGKQKYFFHIHRLFLANKKKKWIKKIIIRLPCLYLICHFVKIQD